MKRGRMDEKSDEITRKVKEVGRITWGIEVYEVILNTIIFFVLSGIIFQFIVDDIFYVITLSAILSVLLSLLILEYHVLKRDTINAIGSKYPELDERLKTAYDNRGRGNVILDDLMLGVSKRMDGVESSSFVDTRKTAFKVYLIVFLIFLLLSVTILDFHGMFMGFISGRRIPSGIEGMLDRYGTNLRDILEGDRWESANLSAKDKEKLGAEPGGEKPGFNLGPVPGTSSGVGVGENTEIYGDASSATLGGVNIDFRLHPEYGGEIHMDDRESYTKPTIPQDVGVKSSEECIECFIGPEHEEIVRRYFEKILGEG